MKVYKMKICLLLTATVVPQYSSNHLKRREPQLRLNDYIKSLNLWISKGPFTRIVFCENSGYDLTMIQKKILPHQNINIEFLSYKDTPVEKYGYGYSELGLIDYAFDNSNLIKTSDFFVKCTGRLYFPKIDKLLKNISKEDLFHIDAREGILFWKNKYIPMQLMLFSNKFYEQYIYNIRDKIEKKSGIENSLYNKFIVYKKKEGCHFRWPCNIEPVGIAAHNDKSYLSIKRTGFNFIRGFYRFFFPKYWI